MHSFICRKNTYHATLKSIFILLCHSMSIISGSVSYTHLDVYKRQGYEVLPVYTGESAISALEQESYDPVSYTHLDVYKRQRLVLDNEMQAWGD